MKGNRSLIFIGICVFFVLGFLFQIFIAKAGALPRRDMEHSIRLDGMERTFVVHTPKGYLGLRPLPLVIVLHGGGGNAANAIRMTGMSEEADREEFIAVYPNGTGRWQNKILLTWNAGNCCGSALDKNVDDVKFIRILIAYLQNKYKIDDKRIYATGMSNGGMMSYRLGCELSDKLAAIAPVAGALSVEPCSPSNPLSVAVFHGTADEHVLYEGGVPKEQRDYHYRVDKPVSYAVSFWVDNNQCKDKPFTLQKGSIVRDAYIGGNEGTEVLLYTIIDGGHAWPGGQGGTPWADTPTQELNATDAMWHFFKSHPKS